MRLTGTILLACLLTASVISAQDDTIVSPMVDTNILYPLLDSSTLSGFAEAGDYAPGILKQNKNIVNDIQQLRPLRKSGTVFLILVVMISLLTFIKIKFGNEMNDLIQSFYNKNIAYQIFRSQPSSITFPSLVLNANFIVMTSLIVRFVLIRQFKLSSLNDASSVFTLIILFTFFYVAKVLTIKLIGYVFTLQEECNEYIYNLFVIFKTLGLALIPVVFVMYTSSEKVFNALLVITFFMWFVFALIFVWRGLSTAYKLLYRSLYHFFIYVCVIEISPIFLLFKLLTKTII